LGVWIVSAEGDGVGFADMEFRMHLRSVWGGLLLASALCAQAQEPLAIRYQVEFKGFPMATQSILTAVSPELRTVTTHFAADLPVFVAMHRYSETLSASFRPDGTVVRLKAHRSDGPMQTDVSGNLESDGRLKVIRRDRDGTTTNFIAREDYDFNSLAIYGAPLDEYLPDHNPVRVLRVDRGEVETVDLLRIQESDTFERQHLESTHLVWKTDLFTSHSWHPERFSNLPRRYIRQTENGEFTFTLQR
jgi:hypothetical protein